MDISHDKEADAAYITFIDEEITKTRQISDEINIDYCPHGIRGIEFLYVSFGIPLEPLVIFVPRRVDEIMEILASNGLDVRNND